MSLALILVLSLGGMAEPVSDLVVPSGQTIGLSEVLVDDVGSETWFRFRFVAPDITRDTGGLEFAQVELDFEHLCTHVALPYLDTYQLSGDIVAITLLDRPMEFGASDPDSTQFIDVFRITSGTCIWEGL